MSKLIGTTEFELTDIRTGEKRTYTKKNMFTNRLNKILSKNPYGAIRAADLMPIANTLLGGIILFPNAQTENAENDILFNSEAITGKKTEAESQGKTKDGYKWVYRFEAEECNGTIASVSLTNGNIGAIGKIQIDDWLDGEKMTEHNYHAYDKETGTFYYVTYGSSYSYDNVLKVAKLKKHPYKIGIGDSSWGVSAEIVEIPNNSSYNMDTQTFEYDYHIGTGKDVDNYYQNSVSFRYEGGTPYLYIFSILTTDTATIHVNKFNMNTNSLESYTKLTDIQYEYMGTIKTNKDTNDFIRDYWLLKDNYLYIYYGSDSVNWPNSVYKININDSTDIDDLGKWTDTKPSVVNIKGSGTLIENEENWSFGIGNFAIENDEVIINGCLCNNIINLDNVYGVNFSYDDEEDLFYIVINILNCYKATINNLETPIIKTVNDVLKITYTITEVESS